jgi:hypothetical protein
MKASVRYLVLLTLVLAVILVLLLSITTPLIYSLDKDTFPSRFHNNTDALKRQSLNSTDDVLSLMQELSDYSGPIILNVRLDDPDQARRDLELYAKKRVAFSNLIVKLDMTESEMQEYAKSRVLQNQLLAELVNTSVSRAELKKLEVRYRDADNPTMLMSVQLEGDALQERMQNLYAQYENQSAVTTAIGKKQGIDTSADEASVAGFRQHVETGSGKQPPVEIAPRRTNLLTFVLIPERVGYGDTLEGSGFLFSPQNLRFVGIPGRNVTLYIDTTPVSVSGTDAAGAYTLRLPVERIAAGNHTVYTSSGTTLSDMLTLTVDRADSITTLAHLGTDRGIVSLTGSVSAGVPVRNASVDIISDGMVIAGTTADTRGQFRTPVNLSPGTHILVARFTGNGFPLRPSESAPLDVDVPSFSLPDFSGLLLGAAAGITLALFAGGAFWYLRRMRGGRAGFDPAADLTAILGGPAVSGTGDAGTPAPVAEDEIRGEMAAVPPEDLFSLYSRVLQEQGISEAAHAVYREFSRRIAQDQQIRMYTGLTPGELSRSCRNKPYCSAFSRFVSLYETVRYGGPGSRTTRAEFEDVLLHAEKQIRGEDHED